MIGRIKHALWYRFNKTYRFEHDRRTQISGLVKELEDYKASKRVRLSYSTEPRVIDPVVREILCEAGQSILSYLNVVYVVEIQEYWVLAMGNDSVRLPSQVGSRGGYKLVQLSGTDDNVTARYARAA